MYNHYIRLQDNKIIKGFSTAFEQPLKDDVLIAEDAQRHFELNGQTNPPLIEEHGIEKYKYKDGKVEERTEEEIQEDIDALPEPEPSETEKLKARVEELEKGAGAGEQAAERGFATRIDALEDRIIKLEGAK